jgi:hypothetical protein
MPTPANGGLSVRNHAAASAAIALAAVPGAALAEGFDVGEIAGAIGNLALTIVCAGLLLYTVKEFGSILGELGAGGLDVGSEWVEDLQNAPKTGGGMVYDDSGSGARTDKEILEELAYRKKYGDGSRQTLDGKRVAPWMNVNEEMVAEIKVKKDAERKKRKEKGIKLPWESP